MLELEKKKKFRSICITLILSLILTCFPFQAVYAVMGSVSYPSSTTTFSSSNTFSGEFCKANVSGTRMNISYQTMIPAVEFRIAFYGVKPKTKLNDPGIYVPAEPMGVSSTGKPIYGFNYTLDFSRLNIQDGEYFLWISNKETPEDTYETTPSNGALYKNLPFRLRNSTPVIFKYYDVIRENQRIQDSQHELGYETEWYLDEKLDDIRFVLRNPATNVYAEMTPSRINYMRKVSDKITAGATTNYDKILKLYEYVTGNFYYDNVALATSSNQFADPYLNLYRQRNKIAGPNSDNKGRVATTCQGFCAMFTSLARAQGIPTRYIKGHRATSPLNNWSTEQNIAKRDHWWVECYIDGRWIFVDPTIGTNNSWNKDTGVWKYTGLTNYTYFDPSPEQIAVSHIYHDLYPTLWKEYDNIESFLETESDTGTKYGYMLNPRYIAGDRSTWGDGIKSHFKYNENGYPSVIQWSYKNFGGDLKLQNLTRLKTLSMHDNNFKHADISGCLRVAKVYLQNNQLETLDMSDCKRLEYVNVTTGNALKQARIYANKKNVNIKAEENGTFQIKYDSRNRLKLQIIGKPVIGYKVKGFYNGANVRVSTNKSYSLNPAWINYTIRFTPNPKSYVYYLTTENNSAKLKPYNLAAQKRLVRYGYLEETNNGVFDQKVKDAVIKFQIANGLSAATGNIGSATWAKLFSTNAKMCPTDEEIEHIKAVNAQSLDVMAEGGKKKVKLSWTNPDPDAVPVGGYQIYRSLEPNSGFKKIASTKEMQYTDTTNMKYSTKYYYKIRVYKTINSKTYYGQWTAVNAKTAAKPKPQKPAKSSKSEPEEKTLNAEVI